MRLSLHTWLCQAPGDVKYGSRCRTTSLNLACCGIKPGIYVAASDKTAKTKVAFLLRVIRKQNPQLVDFGVDGWCYIIVFAKTTKISRYLELWLFEHLNGQHHPQTQALTVHIAAEAVSSPRIAPPPQVAPRLPLVVPLQPLRRERVVVQTYLFGRAGQHDDHPLPPSSEHTTRQDVEEWERPQPPQRCSGDTSNPNATWCDGVAVTIGVFLCRYCEWNRQ